MTRTRWSTLLLLALIGGVVTWMLEVWLVSNGRASFVTPISLPIVLLLIAIVVIAVAWPIRQYTRVLWRIDKQHRERDRSGHRLAGDGAGADSGPGTGADDGVRGGELSEEELEARKRRPNPFRAMRVLALAKASGFAGALFFGSAFAMLAFIGSRTVFDVGSLWLALFALVASGVLVAAALVAEHWCKLPPGGSTGVSTSDPVGA